MGGPFVINRCLNPFTVVLGVSGSHIQPDPLDTTHRTTKLVCIMIEYAATVLHTQFNT